MRASGQGGFAARAGHLLARCSGQAASVVPACWGFTPWNFCSPC